MRRGTVRLPPAPPSASNVEKVTKLRQLKLRKMRTEVAITVDTEFNIGGALTFPDRFRPISNEVVDCVIDGRSEGLGFILETLARYGLTATFFVEALNHRYFGDVPMAKVCKRLNDAGQDVQLHIHPCWLSFENGSRAVTRFNDNCAGRTVDEMVSILNDGLKAFERWGVSRPVAMRTGNFSVDESVYDAMSQLGVIASSNIATTISPPANPAYCVSNGRFQFHGVTEVPLTNFSDVDCVGISHQRALTITACSWSEIKSALWCARRSSMQTVVILTHAFEFVKSGSFRFERLRRNRVNQRRFERLCEFLSKHSDDFVPVTFGGKVGEWAALGQVPSVKLIGSPIRALARATENFVNDRIWAY